MKFRDCIRSGLIMAVFMAWFCEPLIDTALTIEPDGMDHVPLWMRIIGLIVCGSPVIASLIFVPIFIAFFMAATNKIESVISDFIRQNNRR